MDRVIAAGTEVVGRDIAGRRCGRLAADDASAGLGLAPGFEEVASHGWVNARVGVEERHGLEAEIRCGEIALLQVCSCIENAEYFL